MKLLSKLNENEIKDLYAKNDFLKNQARDGAIDELYFWAGEKMVYFKGIKSLDYNFGYPGNYINVKDGDYKDFISACLELAHDMCIFTDNTVKKLERAKAKADFYYDALIGYEDISDARFENLEKWMDGIIELAENELIEDYCNEESYYYTDKAAFEYFQDIWMDANGDAYQTDGEYVYETEYRKYD